MTQSSTKNTLSNKLPPVRSFESVVNIKGYKIAYVLWTPIGNNSTQNTISDDMLPSDGYRRLSPLSMSSHFETMVCSHGWLDNANSFARIAPYLCNKLNMRVIALDLPGHGRSSHSKSGYYTAMDYSIAFIRFLHALDIHEFHFMCHSLSAAILPYTIGIMKGKQWNVKSMICIEQFGVTRSQPNLKRVDLRPYLEPIDNSSSVRLYNSIDEVVSSRLYVTANKYPGKQTISQIGAKLILQRNIGRINTIDPTTREKSVKYFLASDPILRYGGSGPIGNVYVPNTPAMINAILKTIKIPIITIFGKEGWPGLNRVAQTIAKSMPNVKYVMMPGSHHVHLDDPEAFSNQIIPFLQNVINGPKSENKLAKL